MTWTSPVSSINLAVWNPAHSDDLDIMTPTVYWPMVESSLGIVGASLPLLRPVLVELVEGKTFNSIRSLISNASLRTLRGSARSTVPSEAAKNTEMSDNYSRAMSMPARPALSRQGVSL